MMRRPCLPLWGVLGLVAASPILADNVVTVAGDCRDRGVLSSPFGFGTYWQQTAGFSNVTISVAVTTTAGDDGTPVLGFLTHDIGGAATVADEVARTSFVIPPGLATGSLVTVFKGLELGPGEYFLTLYARTFGTAGAWCRSFAAPTITYAPGIVPNFWSYIMPGLGPSADYPPAGGFQGDYSSTLQFSVTGTPPQPQTGTIIINANLPNATFSLAPPVSGAPSGGPYPVTLQNVPAGQRTVTFNPVSGYTTPPASTQTLTAGSSITFTGTYAPTAPPSCTSVSIDRSLSNGVVDVSLTSSCILTIKNNKNYWTNFTITPVGPVTTTPVGGDQNLYAKFSLLPPSGFLPLPPGNQDVAYTVQFANLGSSITIFADPTNKTGHAIFMNFVQGFLNLIPYVGALPVVIDDYQKIFDAFAQMPHLQAAASAVFSNPPQTASFVSNLAGFLSSTAEVNTFGGLLQSLKVSVGLEVIKAKMGTPWRLLNSFATSFGNIWTFLFGYPSGSISITAQ